MNEFKLIVAGGRDFTNANLLGQEIARLAFDVYKDEEISIVSGMARGADALAHRFAKTQGVLVYEFHADWEGQDKAAGFVRNTDMANFADGLLAFWDGKSSGTAHMIRAMENRNKPVHVVRY